MSTVNDLKNSLANSANGPMQVRVDGLGESREHRIEDQLKILTAFAATAAGPRAGIKRVGIRVSSPSGLRFHVPEDHRW